MHLCGCKERSGIIHRALIIVGASPWPQQQKQTRGKYRLFYSFHALLMPAREMRWMSKRGKSRVAAPLEACKHRDGTKSIWCLLPLQGALCTAELDRNSVWNKNKAKTKKWFKNETKNFREKVRRNEKCFPPKLQQNDKLLLPFRRQARKPLFTSIIYFWSLKIHYHINSLRYTIWATKWVYLMPS